MKRKILASCILALSLCLCFALVSCVGNESGDNASTHKHTYGEWNITIAPTCTELGLKEKKCSCGYSVTEKIKANAHKYSDGYCTVCEEREPSEGLEYTLSPNGEYYIVSGVGTCTNTELYISGTYEGLPIRSIENYAFKGCTSFTRMIIGKSVTHIGYSAFEDCTSLTSVTIGDGIESIYDTAFKNCTNLTEINFNAVEMRDVDDNDFIFDNAGKSGNGITVNIGGKVTKIPSKLFRSNAADIAKITNVVFEENSICTSIGENAFKNSTSLKGITIPESVTIIDYDAFWNCTSLISVTIGNGVTSIGDRAFMDCRSLTSLTIPEGVEGIGEYAFCGCTSLTSLTMSESVGGIGADAFSRCTSLTSVNYLGDKENWCNIYFAERESNPLCYSNNLYIKGELVTEMVIPNTVTEIKRYAFNGYTSLTSIVIPDSVISIGESAFEDCTHLTSITIPDSVTSIDESAFLYCENLEIYCEAESQPSGWNSEWNSSDRPVIWGYVPEE